MTAEESRQLGIVIGKMEEIGRRLDRQDDERRLLRERVEETNEAVANVQSDLRTVKDDVAEMKPEVALVKNLKAKAAGAALALGAIGAVFGWAIGLFWDRLVGVALGMIRGG